MNYEENKNLFKKISKDYCLGPRHHLCFHLFENENIKSILDIGCLNGDFLTLFNKNIDKYGIDLKKPKKPKKNIKFKKADLNKKIPFPNKKFDAIYAGEVIEHLYNTDFFLKECNRILKNKGIIVLTTINLSSLYNLIQTIQKKQPYCVDFKENKCGHVRYFSIDTIKKILKKNNFQLEKLFTLHQRFKFLNKLPIFKERGEYLIIKARKS